MSSSDESDEESSPPVDDGGLWSPDTKHKVQLSKIMIEAYARRTGRPYKNDDRVPPIPGIASQSTTATRQRVKKKEEEKKKKAAENSTENPIASSLMHILNQVPPIQGSVLQSTSATQQQANRYGRTGENSTRNPSAVSSVLNSLTRRAPIRIPRGYYPEYLLPNSAEQVPPLDSSTINTLKRMLNAPPGETFEESRRIAGSSNPRRNPQPSDNLHRPTTGEAFIEQFDRMKGKGSAMNVGGGSRQNPNTHGRNIPNASMFSNQNQHFAHPGNNPNFYDQRNIHQQYHGPPGGGAAAVDPMQPFLYQNELPNNLGNNIFQMQDAAQQYVIPPPHHLIPMLNAPPGPVDFQEYPGPQPSVNMAYNNMFQAGPAHANPPAFPGNYLQNMPWEPNIDIDIPLNVMPQQWQQYPQWNNAGQGNAYQGFNPGYHMQHDPMNPNPIDLNMYANRFNEIWANVRRERAQNPSADHTGASGIKNQVPGDDLSAPPTDGTENLSSTVQESTRNVPGSSTQASTTDNSNNDVQKRTQVGNSRSNFSGNNSEKLSERISKKKSTVQNDPFATMSEPFDYTLTNSIPGSSRNTTVQPNMTEDIPEIEVHTRLSEQTERVPESSTTTSKNNDSKNSSAVPAESNDASSSGPIEEENACSLPPTSTQNVTTNDDMSHNAPSSSKDSEEKSEWKPVKPRRQRRLRLDLGNISQVPQDEQGPSQNQNEEYNQNNHHNNQSHNISQNSLSNNQNPGRNEQSSSKQQNKKNNVDNQQNSNNKNNRKKK